MTVELPIEFGDIVEGEHYQPRPGSYGVIFRAENEIAVVKYRERFRLPGGGADPGESPEETLQREVMEEIGYGIAQIKRVGFAIQYAYSEGEGYFAKQCSFYRACVGTGDSRASEDDHELNWLPTEDAVRMLEHESQSWAVSRAHTGR